MPNSPIRDVNVYNARNPWEGNAERLESDALADSQLPAELIRQIRPPLDQIVAFPARTGYPTYSQRQSGIEAVLDFHKLYGDFRDKTSGGVGEIDAAARNIQAGTFG